MKPKVAVTRQVFPEVIARLAERFDVTSNQADKALTAKDLAHLLGDKAGAVTTLEGRRPPGLVNPVAFARATPGEARHP